MIFSLVLVFWGGAIISAIPAMAEDSVSVLMLATDNGDDFIQGNPGGVTSGGPMLAGPAKDTDAGPGISMEAETTKSFLSNDLPPDQDELYNEVRELREIVDRLRQESQAREHLQATREEERDKDAEILEAAGREYSLRPPYTFGMDLSAQYSYNDYDVIRQLDLYRGSTLDYRTNHTITNNLSLESGIRDNLSFGATVPFVFKYDKSGTAESRDVTNLGDISVELKYQPLKTGQGYPSPIFSTEYTLATGKSPYEMNPATELATGSGVESISQRVSFSQPFDPVNAFGSITYTHLIKKRNINQVRGARVLDEVDPGALVGASVGFGYAVSSRMSLSIGLSATYIYSTDYYWLVDDKGEINVEKTSSNDTLSASLSLNTSWRITPGRTLIIGIGKGLTTANPGFSFSIRMPVSFDLR